MSPTDTRTLPTAIYRLIVIVALCNAVGLGPGLTGCSDETANRTLNLGSPIDMAVLCVNADATVKSAVAISPASCNVTGSDAADSKPNQLWGIVTNTEAASIAVINLITGVSEDFDKFNPGYTRLKLSGQPNSIVASPAGTYSYFTQINSANGDLQAAASIGRIDTTKISADPLYQAIPAIGTAITYVPGDDASTTTDQLAVAIPEKKGILLVPVANFGQHDPQNFTFIATPGRPRRMALRQANNQPPALFVAHDDVPTLSIITLPSNEILNISLLPDCSETPAGKECITTVPAEVSETSACSNGLDDDLDGFIDYPEDKQCESAQDDSEMAPMAACNDGHDNDGDGLTDFPEDTDCNSPDSFMEQSQCTDGVNNDTQAELSGVKTSVDTLGRDAAVDGDDPQCAGDATLESTAVPYWVTWQLGIGLPECANGIDDDQDGTPDLADPDCQFSSKKSEFPLTSSPMSDVALSSDGKYAYVTLRGSRQVVVVDAATGETLSLNQRDGDFGHRLWQLEGNLGVVLPTPPVAVTFSPNKLTSNYQYWFKKLFPEYAKQEPNGGFDAESAYIATTAGDVFMIDAAIDGNQVHMLRQTAYNGLTEPLSTVSTPELFDNGKKVSQSFAARADYANLGPFTVDSSSLSYYGVHLTASSRTLRNETWSVIHQGTLPTSHRTTGRIVSQQRDSDGESVAIFYDPYADFCEVGVEPGDILVLRPGYRLSCGSEDSPIGIFKGDRFEFRIRRLTADTLVLESDGAVGIVELTEEEREQMQLNPNDPGDLTYVASLPHPNCFVTAGSYEIEAPAGTYLVVGSQTGYLHSWRSNGGICEQQSNDPLHTGRAREATPKSGTDLDTCTLPLPDSSFENEVLFSNFLFSFNVRPGCVFDPLTGNAQFVKTPRHLQIRFQVRSGFTAARGVAGTTLTSIHPSPVNKLLYVIDSGGSTITPFSPNTLAPSSPLF